MLTFQDINGLKWFQVKGNALSISSQSMLEDADGNEICGYRKKMLSMHALANITIKDQGKTMVLATIKRQPKFQGSPIESSADIYIHNPPVSIDDVTTSGVSIDDVTTSGLPVAIHVEGDIMSKKYNFMETFVGNLNTNPCKIAQVVRKFKMIHDNNSYFIEIGSNVDIAFICFAAYAIDELFSK